MSFCLNSDKIDFQNGRDITTALSVFVKLQIMVHIGNLVSEQHLKKNETRTIVVQERNRSFQTAAIQENNERETGFPVGLKRWAAFHSI